MKAKIFETNGRIIELEGTPEEIKQALDGGVSWKFIPTIFPQYPTYPWNDWISNPRITYDGNSIKSTTSVQFTTGEPVYGDGTDKECLPPSCT